MGWDSPNNIQSVAEMVEHLTKTYKGDKIELYAAKWAMGRRIDGISVLWVLRRKTTLATEVVEYGIEVFLIERQGNRHWYKGLGEAVHPYYYDCPLEFLAVAPVANASWRKKVLENFGY